MELNETQRMVQQAARDFAQQVVAKHARAMDEEGAFHMEVFHAMTERGLTGIPFSEDYGGAGADNLSYILAIEEIARVCGSTALTLAAHTSLGTAPIYNFGTEEQKKKYVVPNARGEKIGAYGLTEPNAGSDASGTQTTAKKADGGYVLNGSKMFCTNASFADVFTVTAVTDKTQGAHGISAFILEKGWKGLAIAKKEDKLGMRGSDTCLVTLDDVFVPDQNLLGQENGGFSIFMKTLDSGRIGIGALALGLAEGACEKAVRYVQERRQFGHPLGHFQAVQFLIADMATEIEASRLMIYHAAALKDAGLPYSKEASMAKLFSSEMAMRATKNAIQVYGGYGYMSEYEIDRFYRDAKLCEIGEGTSEIQRIVISRHIMGKL